MKPPGSQLKKSLERLARPGTGGWMAWGQWTNLNWLKCCWLAKCGEYWQGVCVGCGQCPIFHPSQPVLKLLSGKKPDKQLRVRTCGHFAMRKEGVCGEPSRPISFFLSLLFLSHRFVNVCSDSVLDLDQTKLLKLFRKKPLIYLLFQNNFHIEAKAYIEWLLGP